MPRRCTPPDSNEKVSEAPAPTNRERERCPSCGAKGKRVERLTVKAMLAVSLRRLGAQRYRFCRTRACPVVYFAEDADEQFTVDEVRERVFQKEPEADDVFVCYCFRHTRGALRQAAPSKHARIVERSKRASRLVNAPVSFATPRGHAASATSGR